MRNKILILLVITSLAGCATWFKDNHSNGSVSTKQEEISFENSVLIPEKEELKNEKIGDLLSLEECISTALTNNRKIRISERRILIARDRVTEASASVLPKLTAEGRYETRNNDRGSSFGGTTFVTGERTAETAKISLIVPVYDFEGASNQRYATRLGVDVARFNSERDRQDLTLAVTQAYFRVLEAEKIKGVVEESIKVVEGQLKIARDFLVQGLVAKNDLLVTEVELAERRQELIRAENNIQLAVSALNRLMGLDVTRGTRIADIMEVTPWKGDFISVLTVAMKRRPDLSALQRQVEIARAEYRSVRAGFEPRIYAFGDYNYSSDDFLLNREWLSGGVAIEFPLFDGGVTYARLKQSKKEIAEAVDLRDDHIDDIILQVKQSYLNLRESAERIPVARKSIELAEENLRIFRDQYAGGLVTSADVLAEEDRLSRARSNYFQSLYGYHEAFARLANAIGATPQELAEDN